MVHDVHFSEEHRRPFVDVDFRPRAVFMPFVRLALARYQEHAIEGCVLSRVVHADFVPLETDGGADVPLERRARLVSAHTVPV